MCHWTHEADIRIGAPMRVGIDLEQFARDPYGSGIQRVLQYLAKEWPTGDPEADFIFPDGDAYALLTSDQAYRILSIPFEGRDREIVSGEEFDLRAEVRNAIADAPGDRVLETELPARYTTWLLPEVSYLPEVTRRVREFGKIMTTVMIGYDALPMTEPRNYRFKPGTARNVSEYFLQLASVDRVICISEYSRGEILNVLRRSPDLVTIVAHPGGDHIEDHIEVQATHSRNGKTQFIRLGTLEARKMPMEILNAFLEANPLNAELVFLGGKSYSDQMINDSIQQACDDGKSVEWIQGASDQEVIDHIAGGDVFLAIGIEGYGIPVLEAIALGTPVLYSGTQPAAEIMDSAGAVRLPGNTHMELVAMFRDYSDSGALEQLNIQVDSTKIPRWKNFAAVVAEQCRI